MTDADARARTVTELIERHGNDIYGLGLRLCGSPEDAQDLTQETFLLAYRKWDQFRGDAKPSTWLYRIAARVCGRQKRRRAGAPKRMESLEELLPAQEPGVVELGRSDGEPHTLAERAEMKRAVERAMSAIPTAFRLPLALKELMELSVEEVAAVLDLKPATVKTRLHRGRLYLAKELRKKLPSTRAPHREHSKAMCLDLLKVKQDSMDRGVAFPVPPGELCARCRSLFSTMDLARDVCLRLQGGDMPVEVRELLSRRFESSGTAARRPSRHK